MKCFLFFFIVFSFTFHSPPSVFPINQMNKTVRETTRIKCLNDLPKDNENTRLWYNAKLRLRSGVNYIHHRRARLLLFTLKDVFIIHRRGIFPSTTFPCCEWRAWSKFLRLFLRNYYKHIQYCVILHFYDYAFDNNSRKFLRLLKNLLSRYFSRRKVLWVV